uniref:Uncharacterized protein n=1 Tax=Aegilops tauschii subsp. strangulata TaxID=200361 RepID=A0A453BLB6_AEGTS
MQRGMRFDQLHGRHFKSVCRQRTRMIHVFVSSYFMKVKSGFQNYVLALLLPPQVQHSNLPITTAHLFLSMQKMAAVSTEHSSKKILQLMQFGPYELFGSVSFSFGHKQMFRWTPDTSASGDHPEQLWDPGDLT